MIHSVKWWDDCINDGLEDGGMKQS